MAPKAEKPEKAAKADKKAEKAEKKDDKKASTKEGGVTGVRQRKFKDHTNKTNKVTGYTPRQLAKLAKNHRRPKAWDLKYRTQTTNGPKYANVLADYPEALAVCMKSGKFNKNALHIRKEKVGPPKHRMTKKHHQDALIDPAYKRVYTHAEKKLQKQWSFKQYRLLFGVYASEESLVKFFKDAPDAAAFVKRNYTHNMHLTDMIQQARQRLQRRIIKRKADAPESITKSESTLAELQKDEGYVKYIEATVEGEIKAMCPLLQAYVVQLIRSKFVVGEQLKEKVIAFAN
jgi:hypothetical protein